MIDELTKSEEIKISLEIVIIVAQIIEILFLSKHEQKLSSLTRVLPISVCKAGRIISEIDYIGERKNMNLISILTIVKAVGGLIEQVLGMVENANVAPDEKEAAIEELIKSENRLKQVKYHVQIDNED